MSHIYNSHSPKGQNMNMRFEIWNVRNLYRTGSLMTVLKELSKYKVELVGGQWHRTCRRIQGEGN
jgi:hypothetical protein